ncbi:DeoR family transcriptional regulator [Fervidicella metallireducens AeB]|uniref:DeoR family transcriptional regulator n=1 Tax=Fervidicella metallireducens AeB TaxID=1403537 RepID=A0A017RX84_9CLOT|nr:transcription factor FapR [Fervidicella metallireducens]EYE89302.1 DeoR family transcriptional regulator [Fervidicella metallireducens AeB]
MNAKLRKHERQLKLQELLKEEPFITDEELALKFGISVQTIRLDRMELGIPELRERVKSVAENKFSKVKAIAGKEFVGDLIDIVPGKNAISILDTDNNMVFEKTKVVKGQYIYSMAETLALAIVDAKAALTGVANIKYKRPVYSGERLVAKGEVIRTRGNKFFVWVFIYINQQEVFRGKFVLAALKESKGE